MYNTQESYIFEVASGLLSVSFFKSSWIVCMSKSWSLQLKLNIHRRVLTFAAAQLHNLSTTRRFSQREQQRKCTNIVRCTCIFESFNLLSSLHFICFLVDRFGGCSLMTKSAVLLRRQTGQGVFDTCNLYLNRKMKNNVLRRLWKGRLILIKQKIGWSSDCHLVAPHWMTIALSHRKKKNFSRNFSDSGISNMQNFNKYAWFPLSFCLNTAVNL